MEKDFNLSVALLLESQLVEFMHEVLMTRRADRTLSLKARADFANRHEADLFISIHANASVGAVADGIETYHAVGSAMGTEYATQIQAALLSTFRSHRDRGVKTARYDVLLKTAMPAVLVECEFIDRPAQESFLRDEGNQGWIADAIARGVEYGTFDVPPSITMETLLARHGQLLDELSRSYEVLKEAAG